jgi:hypothetical protein
MDDVASLSGTDLDARLRDGITRRLDAVTPQDRARAGADLIAVLQEIRRRDAGRDGRAARDGRADPSHDGHADGSRDGHDGHSGAPAVRSAPTRRG